MLSYLEIALINAVMIIPLAAMTEAASRIFRRPALTHLLWVLILVKLVAPPVWQVPLLDPDWVKMASRHLIPNVILDGGQLELNPLLISKSDESSISSRLKPRPRTLASQEKRPGPGQLSIAAVIVHQMRSENLRQLVQTGLLIVWSLGALVWFSVQGARCVRFRLSLHRGCEAGAELQRFADRLARRLGLQYSPTVWLMPGVMSPMLWGSGQSQLLIFPEQMLDRLDDAATGTLLTHELAHYRRRDHWVRVIALLVTGFFWWHPVVWWARREIETAEEECCDAMVVATAAAPPKCYAEAILDVIDFLAERKIPIPALATGLGQVPFLRQRLTWIMRGPRRQDFGYCGRVLCLVCIGLLPLQPGWLAATTSRPQPGAATAPPAGRKIPPFPSPLDTIRQEAESVATIDVFTHTETPEVKSRWVGLEVWSHSSDGRFVVMVNDAIQCLFDFKTGREFDLSDFSVRSMAFVPDSREFVTLSGDGFLRLWNAEDCEVLRAWEVPAGSLKTVDVSSSGEWIVTGGRDGIVRIWNRSSSRPVKELAPELAPVNSVTFSSDQSLLAVATGDELSPGTGRIAIFETQGWGEKIQMNWNFPTAAVAFSSDRNFLISGDWRGRISRWNLARGELVGMSDGHRNMIGAAGFSSSGSRLLEIDVPDLPSNTGWDDEPVDVDRRLFGDWGSRPGINSTASPRKP